MHYVHRQVQNATRGTRNAGLPLKKEKGWLGYGNRMEVFVSFACCIINVLPTRYN